MEELLQMLRSRLAVRHDVTPESAMISSGLIDSFAIADLLADLKEHFRVEIEASEIGVDNFDTPAQMFEFISARQ